MLVVPEEVLGLLVAQQSVVWCLRRVQLCLQRLNYALVHDVLLFGEDGDWWLLSHLSSHDVPSTQLSQALLAKSETDLLDRLIQHALELVHLVGTLLSVDTEMLVGHHHLLLKVLDLLLLQLLHLLDHVVT